MFKVGDKVERIICNNEGFCVGETGIITEMQGDWCVVNDKTQNPRYLKLVEEPVPYFANAQVGDKVISCVHGEGTILDADSDKYYPILVEFEKLNVSFILTGQRIDDELQTLFYAEGYKPPVPGVEPKRLPNFEHDEVIMVRDFKENKWVPRHFASFDDEGNCCCYSDGCSSKTIFFTEWWNCYKKYEE